MLAIILTKPIASDIICSMSDSPFPTQANFAASLCPLPYMAPKDLSLIHISAPTRAQPAASRRTPLRPLFAWDNALAESFFKTLKRELVNGKGCKTREGAKQAVFKYIELCCNTRKVHSSIGYNAPCDPKRDAA